MSMPHGERAVSNEERAAYLRVANARRRSNGNGNGSDDEDGPRPLSTRDEAGR